MKIKLSNNVEYEVISTDDNQTRVEPSGNPNYRSRIYIYMAEDAMSLEDFVNVFTNKENLKQITFIGETFENVFEHYTFVQSVGKEMVTEVDYTTGETMSMYRLVAKLEQLTYIEQQLRKLELL